MTNCVKGETEGESYWSRSPGSTYLHYEVLDGFVVAIILRISRPAPVAGQPTGSTYRPRYGHSLSG